MVISAGGVDRHWRDLVSRVLLDREQEVLRALGGSNSMLVKLRAFGQRCVFYHGSFAGERFGRGIVCCATSSVRCITCTT